MATVLLVWGGEEVKERRKKIGQEDRVLVDILIYFHRKFAQVITISLPLLFSLSLSTGGCTRWQVSPLFLLWETREGREGLVFLKRCVHTLGGPPTPPSPFFQIREFIVEFFQNSFPFISFLGSVS